MSEATVVDDLIDLWELIAEDRSELAISKIRKVVRADENDADTLELLSIASLKSRQPEEALRAADRAVGNRTRTGRLLARSSPSLAGPRTVRIGVAVQR